MKRVFLAVLLVVGGAASYAQLEGTLAGLTDVGTGTGHFKAQIEQNGTHDPGHAYEDVNNDGLFTNGTDVPIPDEEIEDARYRVEEATHGLVVPRSVGTLEAADGSVELVAGDQGHLVVEVQLEAAEDVRLTAGTDAALATLDAEAVGDVQIDAGAAIDLEGASLEADEGRIDVEAGERLAAREATFQAPGPVEIASTSGSVLANAATIETLEGARLAAGGDVRVDDARIEAATGIDLVAGADVYLKRATLETDAGILLEGGGVDQAVFVEGARLSDDNDTAQASPAGIEIVGTPAEGEVDYTG